jgi:hypothetical protein
MAETDSPISQGDSWPKQTGNDGAARVTVPTTAFRRKAATGTASSDLTSRATSPVPDVMSQGTSELILALRSAFDTLRQQLADAHATNAHLREQNARLLDLSLVDSLQQLLADAHGTIVYLRDQNARLLDLVVPRRPWWRRWFR